MIVASCEQRSSAGRQKSQGSGSRGGGKEREVRKQQGRRFPITRAFALARGSLGRNCRRLLAFWAPGRPAEKPGKSCPDKTTKDKTGKDGRKRKVPARPTFSSSCSCSTSSSSSCSPDLIADCIEYLKKSSAPLPTHSPHLPAPKPPPL